MREVCEGVVRGDRMVTEWCDPDAPQWGMMVERRGYMTYLRLRGSMRVRWRMRNDAAMRAALRLDRWTHGRCVPCVNINFPASSSHPASWYAQLSCFAPFLFLLLHSFIHPFLKIQPLVYLSLTSLVLSQRLYDLPTSNCSWIMPHHH